jgi:RNA polymerase sigma-70 factor (ECF subfamily)
MTEPAGAEITRVLREWQEGDPSALERLIPLVYTELSAIASRQLAREWREDRMHTTTVVQETYVRLFGQRRVDWHDRGHFFAIAAQVMRRVLVDHARRELRQKRGGTAIHVTLDAAAAVPDMPSADVVDLLALDGALEALQTLDPMQCRIVELRFFAGLTVEEAAAALGISAATVKREWAIAKAWLYRRLSSAR